MSAISEEFLGMLAVSADHFHVKLQMSAGVPSWKAMPDFRHQRIVCAGAYSYRRVPDPANDCIGYSILDGPFRSPDVAIYGLQPHKDGAGDVVAVAEFVSPDCELKDRIGLSIHLEQGIADVVLCDPRKNEVVSATPQGQTIHQVPSSGPSSIAARSRSRFDMTLDLPIGDIESAELFDYEPERYWAVWQHPEGRYAYSYDEAREAWLIALGSEEVGAAYLASDARMNCRLLSAYRLDELSLPDAFAAARTQPVPFVSTQGISVLRVLGVVLLAGDGGNSVRHIPL